MPREHDELVAKTQRILKKEKQRRNSDRLKDAKGGVKDVSSSQGRTL